MGGEQWPYPDWQRYGRWIRAIRGYKGNPSIQGIDQGFDATIGLPRCFDQKRCQGMRTTFPTRAGKQIFVDAQTILSGSLSAPMTNAADPVAGDLRGLSGLAEVDPQFGEHVGNGHLDYSVSVHCSPNKKSATEKTFDGV